MQRGFSTWFVFMCLPVSLLPCFCYYMKQNNDISRFHSVTASFKKKVHFVKLLLGK